MPKIQSVRDLIAWQFRPILQKAADARLRDVNHLMIALGSHAELDTQCELASRRHFISEEDRMRVEALIADVGRVTHGLVRSLDPNGQAS